MISSIVIKPSGYCIKNTTIVDGLVSILCLPHRLVAASSYLSMTGNSANEADDRVQIAVTSYDNFMNSVGDCYPRDKHGKLRQVPSQVVAFSDGEKMFENSYAMFAKVNGKEEFAGLKIKLLTLPILVKIKVKISEGLKYNVDRDYVIYINTNHSAIREQLLVSLRRCESAIQEGKNFALQIKLDVLLNKIFLQHRGDFYVRCDSICITNHVERCDSCYSSGAWLMCLPCMLVLATPYCLYRSISCLDLKLNLTGRIRYMHSRDVRNTREQCITAVFTNNTYNADQSLTQGRYNRTASPTAYPGSRYAFDNRSLTLQNTSTNPATSSHRYAQPTRQHQLPRSRPHTNFSRKNMRWHEISTCQESPPDYTDVINMPTVGGKQRLPSYQDALELPVLRI